VAKFIIFIANDVFIRTIVFKITSLVGTLY